MNDYATKKHILSLDFDGVLHPFGAQRAKLFSKMPLIYRILEQYPDVYVIIHSSWRQVHDADVLKQQLFGTRPDLESRFLGVTPVEVMSRWESIEAWVEQHKPRSVCVLDDEARLFPQHIAEGKEPYIRFIECPTLLGLTDAGNQALDSWARSTLSMET